MQNLAIQTYLKYFPNTEFNKNLALTVADDLCLVKYLLEQGADIHFNDDWTLILNSCHGKLENVNYLMEKGANIHADNDYAILLASEQGHLEVVKYLTGQGANIYTHDGPLKLAIKNIKLETVKYLVGQGADIYSVDMKLLKTSKKHFEIVKYLESLQ